MFRLDRSRTAGPRLEWKVRVFVVAAALGLSGIYLEDAWLTGTAILLLLAGVLIRSRSGSQGPDAPEEDGEDAGGPEQ